MWIKNFRQRGNSRAKNDNRNEKARQTLLRHEETEREVKRDVNIGLRGVLIFYIE